MNLLTLSWVPPRVTLIIFEVERTKTPDFNFVFLRNSVFDAVKKYPDHPVGIVWMVSGSF